MSGMRTLDQLELDGKTVLLRTDYNVPLADGKVDDDFRIRASLPTIQYLLDHNCKVIIISHLGRPDGKPSEELSLKPVAARLTDLLRKKVTFIAEVLGAQVEAGVKTMAQGDVVLLENLRFDPREEAGDAAFAKGLASLADVYVDDAFAVAHRAHASVSAVAGLLPSAAGLLLAKEVETLQASMAKPDRPLLAILGGAKVEGKIELLEAFIERANAIFIGGAMANTFLASQGIEVGASVLEESEIPLAKQLLAKARTKGVRVILPTDVVVAKQGARSKEQGASDRSWMEQAEAQTTNLSDVARDEMILDIGPQTIKMALEVIKKGGTVIWNGPLGVDEYPQFAKGTLRLARGIIASKAFSVIGGGDTADVLDKAGLQSKFSFVSTGGGAALEVLAGKALPGVEALRLRNHESRIMNQGENRPVPRPPVIASEARQSALPDPRLRKDDKVIQAPRPLIVANWKANMTIRGAIKLVDGVNVAARKHTEAEVVMCPPSLYLPLLRHGVTDLAVKFGAQDISPFEVGTHTGDLPASLAAQFASYAIVGHSERRHDHHESDKQVGAKVARALQASLQPIICVGDRLHQRQTGLATRVVHDQLLAALEFVTAEELDQITIAYEPVWAISSGDGHGSFAAPVDVAKMIAHIQLTLQSRFGSVASKTRILYGGSVNADNARAYLDIKGINGLLVGGASLDAHEFSKIVELA